MIALRIFTEEGKQEFIKYIQDTRSNSSTPRPDLNMVPYSLEFQPRVEISENLDFATRMDMGRYLSKCFQNAGISKQDVIGPGKEDLWTWFAYIWFDRITNNRQSIREIARYVCSSDYTDYYRHYVASLYYLFFFLGEKECHLFLYSPPYQHNDFIEQFASRQYIIAYPEIIKVAHRLYWDSGNRSPKRGAQSRRRLGNHRRLIKIIGQLELTYDIYTMSPDEILNLLPSEFNEWKR